MYTRKSRSSGAGPALPEWSPAGTPSAAARVLSPASRRAPIALRDGRTPRGSGCQAPGPTALALQLEERRLVPAAGAPLGAVVTDGSRFRGGADPRPKASPGEV